MNKWWIWMKFLLAQQSLFSAQPLDPKYCISYGEPTADVKVMEYFSFSCPHCIHLFKEEFSNIQKSYIDNRQVYWVFHPVPMDKLTVQAMACLEHLSEDQKRAFLESLLLEIEDVTPDVAGLMMQRAMEMFKHPMPQLLQMESLENTEAFQAAYQFVSQDNALDSVPAVEINGVLHQALPTREFIQRILDVKPGENQS